MSHIVTQNNENNNNSGLFPRGCSTWSPSSPHFPHLSHISLLSIFHGHCTYQIRLTAAVLWLRTSWTFPLWYLMNHHVLSVYKFFVECFISIWCSLDLECSPCVENLVPSPWYFWEVVDPLRCRPWWEVLDPGGPAPERNCGILVSCSFSLPGHHMMSSLLHPASQQVQKQQNHYYVLSLKLWAKISLSFC